MGAAEESNPAAIPVVEVDVEEEAKYVADIIHRPDAWNTILTILDDLNDYTGHMAEEDVNWLLDEQAFIDSYTDSCPTEMQPHLQAILDAQLAFWVEKQLVTTE